MPGIRGRGAARPHPIEVMSVVVPASLRPQNSMDNSSVQKSEPQWQMGFFPLPPCGSSLLQPAY